MIVRFLETQDDYSQLEIATVRLEGGEIIVESDEFLADTLLEDVDRTDRDAVLKVMRLAPERFDGAYLRATFEGDQEAK